LISVKDTTENANSRQKELLLYIVSVCNMQDAYKMLIR